MAEQHGCREIFLSSAPENRVAERLYAGTGFVPTGRVIEGEVVARLDLKQAQPRRDVHMRLNHSIA